MIYIAATNMDQARVLVATHKLRKEEWLYVSDVNTLARAQLVDVLWVANIVDGAPSKIYERARQAVEVAQQRGMNIYHHTT